MKFRIDDIVLPGSEDVARQFDCAVCLHIASEPMMQTLCGHVYCKDCVAPCRICPQCREPLDAAAVKPLSDVNKMGMRLMYAVKVRCPYSGNAPLRCDGPCVEASSALNLEMTHQKNRQRLESEPLKTPQCAWEGGYGDLLAIHLGACPRHPVPCPHSCGATLFRAHVAPHRLVCELSFEDCPICGDRVLPGCMPEHRREKSEVHVELLEGKLRENEIAVAEQNSLSVRMMRMEEQIKALAKTEHVSSVVKVWSNEMKEAVRSEVREQMQTRAVWKVKGYAKLLAVKTVGACVYSPKFRLGCIHGVYIKFLPKGMFEGQTTCGVVVFATGRFQASFRFTMCGKSLTTPEFYEWGSEGQGGFDFPMPTAEHLLNDELTIEVELVKSGLVISETIVSYNDYGPPPKSFAERSVESQLRGIG